MVEAVDRDSNLLLFGSSLVRITKDRETGMVSIVSYPSRSSVSFRTAKTPYVCRLHLADDSDVDVDLACAEDWGNIQDCLPDECARWPSIGWGNDADGHVEIIRVTDVSGSVIPMCEFVQDVKDFIIYHED